MSDISFESRLLQHLWEGLRDHRREQQTAIEQIQQRCREGSLSPLEKVYVAEANLPKAASNYQAQAECIFNRKQEIQSANSFLQMKTAIDSLGLFNDGVSVDREHGVQPRPF